MLKRIPRRVWWYSAVLAVFGVAISSSWWFSCGFHGCPSVQQLQAWRPTEGGALLDRRGALIAPLSQVKRVNVPLSRIAPRVQAAFVAVEDRRFYSHHGIDWRGVARASVENVKALGVREGASTITMQLARNVFLSHRANERSIPRKLLEWRYAMLIERALDKPAILERYLNAIYLGNGVYGVEGASQDLFGKSVRDVTLAEAALLAGLPKAPSSYTPRRDPSRAHDRREIVLDVLEREHVATPAAIAAARATDIADLPEQWQPPRRTDSWAVETVRGVLDSLRSVGAIPASLNDGQLRVRSTFDRRAQFAAERAIASGAAQVDNERGGWRDAPSRTQGALVALDPSTGAIRAIVGGRRIERKGFNRAMRARRQPGSAFKPFVYAVALQYGHTTATMVDDEPITIGEGRDEWTPANFNDDYAGRVTMRDALAHSANAATVRISREVGIPRIIAQAHAMGIASALPDVPALALGAGSVTPLELTAAYAPFGNGGSNVQPYAVEQIEDTFGRVLWSRPPSITSSVLDAREAFLVTSMLRSVVDEGTGRAVRGAGIRGPVAGKTGTTNDGTDVWFVGYTPSLVASVWFGADEPEPLGGDASGGRLAAPVWARFIRDGWHSPEQDVAWRPPSGIVTASIDIGTGALGSDWCGPSRREWFRAGTAPTTSCEAESRIAMLEEPPDAPEPPMPPRVREPELRIKDLQRAVDEAINAIGDRRGRAAARRAYDELRRMAEQERRRRN
ncbi:MAG: PBP1A family penicillin-binding protein [Gemmatimonadaceae bacterium]|nr:PBP1A family penicillin-binding protein [Gemmatimonadaceae bacterium]